MGAEIKTACGSNTRLRLASPCMHSLRVSSKVFGLLHLGDLLTKKLQHLSLCWSSLDLSPTHGLVAVIVNPHLGRFQQNDSAEVGHPHNGLLVSLSNRVSKRGVCSGGKNTKQKTHVFWRNETTMGILVAIVVLHISGT